LDEEEADLVPADVTRGHHRLLLLLFAIRNRVIFPHVVSVVAAVAAVAAILSMRIAVLMYYESKENCCWGAFVFRLEWCMVVDVVCLDCNYYHLLL
jgi:hypothetical protein